MRLSRESSRPCLMRSPSKGPQFQDYPVFLQVVGKPCHIAYRLIHAPSPRTLQDKRALRLRNSRAYHPSLAHTIPSLILNAIRHVSIHYSVDCTFPTSSCLIRACGRERRRFNRRGGQCLLRLIVCGSFYIIRDSPPPEYFLAVLSAERAAFALCASG